MTDERFCLYFQPIIPIKPNAGIGEYGEILLRMSDEKGKLILPGAFLPSAERYAQMLMIDRWVLGQCLGLLKANSRNDRQFTYAVNLSGQALGDENFLDFAVDKIQKTNVIPSQICFEITESVALADMKHVMRFISTLKALGCQFSLDGFGSGLTSFGYLKNIPLDYLKIDGRLIKNIALDPIDQSMVESIQRIGQLMGLKTIAEWAENAETYNMLETMGVDYVQGFWLAKPKPINQFNVSNKFNC
jgi:EAL domain-containing protein (putative c-di-GMP-specific phosphodiesterase class I)